MVINKFFCHVSDLTSNPHFPRINEAVEFKDHKIQVASYLISLKVEPSPALSVNLSSEPLVRIMLTHQLVRGHHGYNLGQGVMIVHLIEKDFILGVHTLPKDATYLQNLLQKELGGRDDILVSRIAVIIVVYCIIYDWLML